jgi:NAD+ synthase (glutamine-hydrolysing)
MRIALAQINATLGDFKKNSEKIVHFIDRAVQRKCDMVVFPECALFGYHPFDMLEREKIVAQQEKELNEVIKAVPADMAVVVGLITKNPSKLGRPYYNSAAVLVKGKKPQYFHKTLLPTGDVFDEARFIEQGDLSKNFFTWKKKKFYLTICEDIWAWTDEKGRSPYKRNPLKDVKKQKIDLILNLSASPYFPDKLKLRERVVAQTAKYFGAPMIYVNLVGAQDEIIFDGASFAVDKKGQKKLSCLQFEEDINVLDLETLEPWMKVPVLKKTEELRKALVLGIQDFCGKSGLSRVHFGLSGGIDSAVVAALAVDALGPANVSCFALPGPYSSKESLSLAQSLAKNLGINFREIKITPAYEFISKQLEKDLKLENFGVVHENLQARLRGLILMAYSNQENSLLLTTGNKVEYASGYSTLYGDMCGGLAPIGDLIKRQVYELARYYNSGSELIPQDIIDRAPTAELRPNQKDQDTLPAYDDLDKSVEKLVAQFASAKTASDRWLLPVLLRTEFKRWQAAPILKVSAHSFGRGRRYPIAHQAKEL